MEQKRRQEWGVKSAAYRLFHLLLALPLHLLQLLLFFRREKFWLGLLRLWLGRGSRREQREASVDLQRQRCASVATIGARGWEGGEG